jgi:hypothetical protein
MDEAAAEAIVLNEKVHYKRIRVFSALLAKESGLGTAGMTVVGGSAMEIYTGGDYVSDDLDLVVDSRSRITTVLKQWGFRNDGKIWSKKTWDLYVDPMETQGSGSRRLTQVISTSVGPVRIAGVEDLIIRRVRESVAWQNRQEAFAQAILLVEHSSGDLDWDYIGFFAKQEGWEKQLGLLRVKAGLPRPSILAVTTSLDTASRKTLATDKE